MKNKTNKNELSYYGDYLIRYLQENHPEKEINAVFIKERSDAATEAFESLYQEGHSAEGAQEEAMKILLSGLYFSEFNIVIEILWNECNQEVRQEDAEAISQMLLPLLETVFDAYPIGDDMLYGPVYDLLYKELTGTIRIIIEKNGFFSDLSLRK